MDDKTLELIIEAHNLGMSIKETAEYAGVSERSVYRYWKKRELQSPERKKSKLTQLQIEKITAAHFLKMSYKEAAEYAGVSPNTVDRHWKKQGLKPHNSRPKPTPAQFKKMVEAHSFELTQHQAAKYAGVSRQTVCYQWEKQGLKSHNTQNRSPSLTEEQIERVYKAHSLGMKLKKAAAYADTSMTTVRRYWNRKGLEAHNNRKKSRLNKEQIKKIKLGHTFEMSQRQTAEFAGVTHTTVGKYWKEQGLEPINKECNELREEKIEKIVEAHELKMTPQKAAEYARVDRITVSKYWEKQGLETCNKMQRQRLTEEQVKKIIEAGRFGVSKRHTAEFAGVSQATVGNYWKKYGTKSNTNQSDPANDAKTQIQNLEKIIEAHSLGMNTRDAAKYAGVGLSTVRNYWIRHGLKPHNKKPPILTEEQLEKITEAHSLQMSRKQASEYAGVSPTTVSKYWKKQGLKPYNEKSFTLTEEQFEKITEAHSLGMNAKQAAKYAEVSKTTVNKYWKIQGLESQHRKRTRLTEKQKEKIVQAHSLEITLQEAAKYVGVDQSTVYRCWKRLGLKPHNKRGESHLTKEQLEKINEAHTLNMQIGKAAIYAGVGEKTVRKYWKKQGLAPPHKTALIEKITEAHSLGMNTIQIAEHADVSTTTVRKYLKITEFEPNYERITELTEEHKKRISEAHSLKMSVNKAAEYAGVSRSTVYRHWKKQGLEAHNKQGKPNLTEEQLEKIINAHSLKMRVIDAAEYASVGQATVSCHWKKQGLKPHYKSGSKPDK